MKKGIFIVLGVIISAGFFSIYQVKAEEFATKLKGRILLQVESKGEAWYINPENSKRYYMANGSEAYNIMRTLGVGITNKNLEKIKASKTYAKTQQGKIFLQIESKGEAYYIDIKGIAHYLKDGTAAYNTMRELGLGIKNSDLVKINLSDEDKASSAPVAVVDTYDFKISSSSCVLTNVPTLPGFDQQAYVRAIVSGTAQGPVGTRIELPILIWSTDIWDCGDWTLTRGAWIAVGSTCTRKEGQPEKTTWTIDTGGEEFGAYFRGASRFYSAKIYKKDSILDYEKEATTSYTCQ